MLQSSVVSALPLFVLQQLFLLGSIAGSFLVARRLWAAEWRLTELLRRRFVLGVPWGTLLTMLGVLTVYWVVQDGWKHPHDPMVIPFYSWSYFYPLGTIVSPFAHQGQAHLTGNLRGTLLFAPVVEYVVGHYPRERGSQSFASWRTSPFVRILAVPAGSVLVGLFTGVFSAGPVIGFSGVVFAYAGFAVAARPLIAVMALVSERVVGLVYRSLRTPRLTRQPSEGVFSPWWANIAIQGHAIGILLGAGIAVWLLRRRDDRPVAMYLWFAAVVFGIRQSLWAIYRPVGANSFVLYRAVGVGLVFVFAAVIATAVCGSDRPLLPSRSRLPSIGVPRRTAATLVVVVLLAGISAAAIPFGLATVSADLPERAETVEVRDYTVTYVEGVPNEYTSFANKYIYSEGNEIRSSGVVVISERRNIWLESVSKRTLKFNGWGSVQVGGIGWREQVYANRKGWSLVGNETAYKVTLRRDGGQKHLAYTTDPVMAGPTIAGRNVSIVPVKGGFEMFVTEGNATLGRSPIPPRFNETTIGGLTLNRTDRKLFAVYNDTRVRVAKKAKTGRQKLKRKG